MGWEDRYGRAYRRVKSSNIIIMDNTTTETFLDGFTTELLEGAGMKKEDPHWGRLVETLNERIISRLFLELVSILPKEEAAAMRADMGKEQSAPELLLQGLLQRIPDVREKILLSLAAIRAELELDLRQIVATV